MKKIYIPVLMWLMGSVANAQVPVLMDNTKVIKCYTVETMEEGRRQKPGAETDAQFESWIQTKMKQDKNQLGRIAVVNYTIPVVFHIIHNGEAVGTTYNVPQEAIQQQILQLNKDYANQSNSPYGVSSTTGLTFVLAQNDSLGNPLPEPGIDRINRNTKGWTDPTTTAGWTTTYITNTVKPSSIWRATRYLNVWLVPYMPQSGGEILGYATFPNSALPGMESSNEDNYNAGVVLKYSAVGSVFQPYACTSTYGQGRTLTHELGHFFGMRHIWGDATCGTDYVNDTPIHLTSNSGVPTHPKPNSCGTADEMFENYMDYSNDNVLNTFTSNQVDRMQTVMSASPRRGSLATSTVGFVPVTATNRIAFSDCSGAVTVPEIAISGTYPRYRDISLYLNVEDKATGTAVVTLVPTGNAIANRDYILLNPSVTFAAGETYKSTNIRILDNATVDGTRTLSLSYTISGTGVTAGTAVQTFVVTILDDDNFITSQSPIVLVNESFEGSYPGWAPLTFSGTANFFTVSTNGNAGGSGACAHITNDNVNKPNTYTKTTAVTAGFRTPLINSAGLQNINVSFNYQVYGQSTSTVATDYGRMYYSLPAAPSSYFGVSATGAGPYAGVNSALTSTANFTLPTSFNSSSFNLAMLWINNASAGNDPPINFDNFVVTGDGTVIETAVSSSYGYDVPSGTTNNFRSTNNKSVAMLAAVNAGLTNVTAAVTEAGVDRPTFAANGTNYMRTRKVISVTPSPNNATAQYTIKLYYTAAELAAWGATIPNLKIMKVTTGTSLSSAINNGNALIVTPTQFEDSSASRGYYAFTATFTGFSQFVLVDPTSVLPLNWLSFTGVLDKNQAKLNWKTNTEINNKGFDVERSTDAVNFTKIAWVDAQINNTATNSYQAYDATIVAGTKYYYRLKQVDKDGRYTYSGIVIITYAKNGSIVIYPNPVKDRLTVQNTNTNAAASVMVADITGKVLYRSQFAGNTLDINTAKWSAGVYTVTVINDEKKETFKVLKQ